MEEIVRPDVFEYLHVTPFLEDYIAFRRRRDSRFSFESWSKELGFRSRSYLRMLIVGKKKVSESFARVFCESVGFTDAEREYFGLLVQYSQARTQNERTLAGRRLIGAMIGTMQAVEIDEHFKFVSDPTLPRLFTFLSFDDIATTALHLSRLIERPVERTEECLGTLAALGLAEPHEIEGETHWRAKKRIFKVPERIGDAALANFHEISLNDAVKALRMSPGLRRYRSLLIPLSQDEYARFLAMVNDFANEVIAQFHSDKLEGRNLFQVNLNVFSLTPQLPLTHGRGVSESVSK